MKNAAPNATRVPPSDVLAEQALLGSILIEGTAAFDDAAGFVRPEDFYLASHGEIFRQMAALRDRGEPLDTIVIHDALRKSVESAARAVNHDILIEALESVPHGGHAVYYAKIIAEKWRLRQTQLLIRDLDLELQYGPEDYSAAMARFRPKLDAIEDSADPAGILSMEDLAHDFLQRLEMPRAGLLTGLCEVDKLIGGLRPGQFVVLAARTSKGKTALAGNIVLNVAEAGTPVLFLSLEMEPSEIFERFVAAGTRIPTEVLYGKTRTEAQNEAIVNVAGQHARLPIFYRDRTELTAAEIRRVARVQCRQKAIGLIAVDYLQLIRPADCRAPRHQQVAEAGRAMKSLARELKIPVLALAQLNRNADDAKDRHPRLVDIGESGTIEQDADIVLFLERPGEEQIEQGASESEATLTAAKHRNGRTGKVSLHWHAASMTFSNAAPAGMRNPFGDFQ